MRARHYRFGVLALMPLAGAMAMAGGLRGAAINRDSRDTYRMALSELRAGSRQKGIAILRGLLMSSVRIGIDDSSLPGDADVDFRNGIARAISNWNRTLSDRQFVLEKFGSKPDIVVRFVSQVGNGDGEQGIVHIARSFSWGRGQSKSATRGSIEIRDNVEGRLMTGGEIARVMAHELGHVLGLDDSPGSGGVMDYFTAGSGRETPSLYEIRTVRHFRAALRTALGQK